MKKTIALLLTVCICLSFAGMVSASAASVRWTPVEISDELKAEIYENYTQYQYSLDVQDRMNLGMPVLTYEEYAEKHKMEDITFFRPEKPDGKEKRRRPAGAYACTGVLPGDLAGRWNG